MADGRIVHRFIDHLRGPAQFVGPAFDYADEAIDATEPRVQETDAGATHGIIPAAPAYLGRSPGIRGDAVSQSRRNSAGVRPSAAFTWSATDASSRRASAEFASHRLDSSCVRPSPRRAPGELPFA